jgi:hypothetical protein
MTQLLRGNRTGAKEPGTTGGFFAAQMQRVSEEIAFTRPRADSFIFLWLMPSFLPHSVMQIFCWWLIMNSIL